MRCSNVTDVIVIARRHVGGTFNVNKDELNKREILKFLYRDYS